MRNGDVIDVSNPVEMPDPVKIKQWEEAYWDTTIMTPKDYFKEVHTLCTNKRGEQTSQEFIEDNVIMKYSIPLSEMIDDFFDVLKSISSGYASIEYKVKEFRPTELEQVIFHLNGESVDALTFLVFKEKARQFAQYYTNKLIDILPRQQISIAIQAKIGGKVICRGDIKAFRKNVTARWHGGGDPTRKRKLLENQKRGKKLMRSLGKINVEPDVFFKLLKK